MALAFLQEVERLTGREPAIYCSASTPREDYDSRLAPYSLWVAQYGAREPESNDIWPTWAGWQYSERGRVDGIEGNVDLDLFTAEMRAEPEPTKSASPTAAPTPSPAPTATCAPTATAATGEANAYVGQEGDTLTAIAQMFDTTVASLAETATALPTPRSSTPARSSTIAEPRPAAMPSPPRRAFCVQITCKKTIFAQGLISQGAS